MTLVHGLRDRFSRARARLLGAVVVQLMALALVASASAQVNEHAGHLGVYFDTEARLDMNEVAGFIPFKLYILADFSRNSAPGGSEMAGWEAVLSPDARVTVTGMTHAPHALNLADGLDFLVGFGIPMSTSSSPLLLLTVDCILLQSDVADAVVDIASTDVNGSFGGQGPGWATSGDNAVLVAFDSWSGVLINPREGLSSWGEVKTTYSGSF